MDQAKNFAKATVADNNYDASATSIDVLSGEGARFPATPFNAVWWNATDYPDPADDPAKEIVRVTNISTDTLTITRAQEGTAASDHNVAGKTYKLMAGITAKTINEDLVGDVFGSGPAITFNPATPVTRWMLNNTDERYIQLGTTTEIQSVRVTVGDSQGQGNSGVFDVDDGNSRAVFSNLDLATTQSESATGPAGTVVGKLAIRDGSGTLLGYLPIYDSIT